VQYFSHISAENVGSQPNFNSLVSIFRDNSAKPNWMYRIPQEVKRAEKLEIQTSNGLQIKLRHELTKLSKR